MAVVASFTVENADGIEIVRRVMETEKKAEMNWIGRAKKSWLGAERAGAINRTERRGADFETS